MSDEDWNTFHQRWARLTPPLRANHEVAAAIGSEIRDRDRKVLLLGVTPELCDIAQSTVAVDKSQTMISGIWPGDTDRRKAVLGNWLSLPILDPEFTAVIGDGSLNAVDYCDFGVLFADMSRVLLAGARLAIRVYETPSSGEGMDALFATTMAGGVSGFHAFKWRIAMAIAWEAKDPSVPVKRIHEKFQSRFPNRVALSAATGWTLEEIGEIDAYEKQSLVYSFPNRAEILDALPPAFREPRFVPSGTYELAERCPILVADFHP